MIADCVTLHDEYLVLGKNEDHQLAAHRHLFDEQLAELGFAAIRDASKKDWPLGSDRFRQ